MEEFIMSVLKKSRILILITLGLLIFAACTTKVADISAPAAATLDLNGLRTQVAQTVVANLTVVAAANPTSTPTAENTATLLPSQTPFSTETEISGIGGDLIATGTAIPVPPSGNWVVYPTKTKTPYVDSAKLTGQVPQDGYSKKQGLSFPVKWTFQNTGMRKWNTDFYIKYVSGDIEPENEGPVLLDSEVKQGNSISVTTILRTPHKSGNLRSNWVLINDDGVAILHFYLLVKVP